MIDAAEISADTVDYTADPEVPIAPDLSLPEVELAPVRPAPEVTTLDPVPDGLVWPSSVKAVIKAAEAKGWQARQGYARGYVDAAKRGTFKLMEFANVWIYQPGRSRMVFTWERNPASEAKGGPAWKATTGLEFDSIGMARDVGHMAGRRML